MTGMLQTDAIVDRLETEVLSAVRTAITEVMARDTQRRLEWPDKDLDLSLRTPPSAHSDMPCLTQEQTRGSCAVIGEAPAWPEAVDSQLAVRIASRNSNRAAEPILLGTPIAKGQKPNRTHALAARSLRLSILALMLSLLPMPLFSQNGGQVGLVDVSNDFWPNHTVSEKLASVALSGSALTMVDDRNAITRTGDTLPDESEIKDQVPQHDRTAKGRTAKITVSDLNADAEYGVAVAQKQYASVRQLQPALQQRGRNRAAVRIAAASTSVRSLDEIDNSEFSAALPVPSRTPEPAPRDEANLLREGREVMRAGDVERARLLFMKAVKGSPAAAALALARSYDPNFVQTIVGANAHSDIAEAERWYRKWYQVSVRNGHVSSSIRLERLLRAMRTN